MKPLGFNNTSHIAAVFYNTIYMAQRKVTAKIAIPTGDFIVVHSPNHMKFLKDANAIHKRDIGPLIAAAFGFSLEGDLDWNGLMGNPFKKPKATALISISGVPAGRLNVKNPVAKYETAEDVSSVDVAYIIRKIEEISWKSDPLAVEASLEGTIFSVVSRRSELFAGLPLSLSTLRDDVTADVVDYWFSSSELASLNISNDSDMAFVGELYMVQKVVNALSESKEILKTNSPDVYHFTVDGLNALAVSYGSDSSQLRDGLKLLEDVVARVSNQLSSIYKGNILIVLVSSSESGLERAPRLRREATTVAAVTVKKHYSAMFNLLLWFSIIFAMVVFFIAWSMWFMDPGRDSIVYRMTTTRMKAD